MTSDRRAGARATQWSEAAAGLQGRQVSARDWVGQGHAWYGGCPGLGSTGCGPIWALPPTRQVVLGKSLLVPWLACLPGSTANEVSEPLWTQVGAKLATSTGSVL